MNWFRRFMTGRYGADQLSLALLVMAVVLSITVRLIGIPYLSLIVYIPLGLCIFRMLSKNIKRRSMENYKFYMLTSRVRRWFGKIQRRMAESKTHRFFKCPDCKAELRLPKGKGKIVITCPKCRHEFMRKT
ncbi:MAG: hypothetical protein WAP56_11130 [Acetivibrionales bacterium]|jgi:DNA-directed RNA polymerase subunit RPC12/RpoP|nr:hypothetical protein [Bacillota bacterium]NLP07758.1 hypothetical protein [Clostridiaceae bacterium]HOA55860.1 hypothetical protein [Clostridiales bacterium]HQD31648.1 hypothetical protein [Clostridiales bacterium]